MLIATLPAFTPAEFEAAHRLLASRVAWMMGRKMEEADWSDVYCEAKGFPKRGWSNLNIDVIHDGLGVEHKMLRVSDHASLKDCCGETLMHPAATRSIRISSTDAAADLVKDEVLRQYAELVRQRQEKVAESSRDKKSDLRIGWLLWQQSLHEFLYFEKPMIAPDPAQYRAEWRSSGTEGGSRKQSKNLWIYDTETGEKRFSVTTQAGPKIQPYFDVPDRTDPNLYYFRVQGERIGEWVRMWLTDSTHRQLVTLLGQPFEPNLQAAISSAARARESGSIREGLQIDTDAQAVLVTPETYAELVAAFGGAISDEQRAQLLLSFLRSRSS